MKEDPTEIEVRRLLAKAAPLRLLDVDDPRAAELTVIVDKINALRAQQAQAAATLIEGEQP